MESVDRRGYGVFWCAALPLALAVYVWAYFALAERFALSRIYSTTGGTPRSVDVRCAALYSRNSGADETLELIFRPMHWIDATIRANYWNPHHLYGP